MVLKGWVMSAELADSIFRHIPTVLCLLRYSELQKVAGHTQRFVAV